MFKRFGLLFFWKIFRFIWLKKIFLFFFSWEFIRWLFVFFVRFVWLFIVFLRVCWFSVYFLYFFLKVFLKVCRFVLRFFLFVFRIGLVLLCLCISFWWICIFFFLEMVIFMLRRSFIWGLFFVWGVFVWVVKVFLSLFDDVWFLLCYFLATVWSGLVKFFRIVLLIRGIYVRRRVVFLYLWKYNKFRFFKLLSRIFLFISICYSYRYVLFVRKLYVYFIWRHLPLRNTITAVFVEWASYHWKLFSWIVRIVSLLRYIYNIFVKFYDWLVYRRINNGFLWLQNFLFWLNGKFGCRMIEYIYRKIGMLHIRYKKYFSVGSYIGFGGWQNFKTNENFIFWRIYYFIFRSIIVLIVLFFGLVERIVLYSYSYWRFLFGSGLLIPIFWRAFKEDVVMPVLNLPEIKPFVNLFVKKRRRKHSRFFLVWLFFFVMYYVWKFLFIVSRIGYVILRCSGYWIGGVWFLFSFIVYCFSYSVGLWHVVLWVKWVFWNFVRGIIQKSFWFCCYFWFFLCKFFQDFYCELYFGSFIWRFWSFSIYTLILWFFDYFFIFLRFVLVLVNRFLIYVRRLFQVNFFSVIKSLISFNSIVYRFRVWFIYFELYSYVFGWRRFFTGINSVYQLVGYRDFFILWNFRWYVYNNRVLFDYLKFFFWPQLDSTYRSAYVFQEILYSQAFKNLFKYRFFWVDFRSYLWFFFDFTCFFFQMYFKSIQNVYLSSLFFRYLDIFRLFSIRRLILSYIVHYSQLSLYNYRNKVIIRYRQVKYLREFNWYVFVRLRSLFPIIFTKFEYSRESKFIWGVFRYFFVRGIEGLVWQLCRIFFSENVGLYIFFRLCIWFVDLRSRIDFIIEYRQLEYAKSLGKYSLRAKRGILGESIGRERPSRVEKDGFGVDSLKVNVEGSEDIKSFGKSALGISESYGQVLNRYGKLVPIFNVFDEIIRDRIEVNYSRQILNLLRYLVFLIFIVFPWRVLDWLCYWLFDVLFVFMFFYFYLYFRVFILVLGLLLLGVVLVLWWIVLWFVRKVIECFCFFVKRIKD